MRGSEVKGRSKLTKRREERETIEERGKKEVTEGGEIIGREAYGRGELGEIGTKEKGRNNGGFQEGGGGKGGKAKRGRGEEWSELKKWERVY